MIVPPDFLCRDREIRIVGFFSIVLNLSYPLVFHLVNAGSQDLVVIDYAIKVLDVEAVSTSEGFVIMIDQTHELFCICPDHAVKPLKIIDGFCQYRSVGIGEAVIVVNDFQRAVLVQREAKFWLPNLGGNLLALFCRRHT